MGAGGGVLIREEAFIRGYMVCSFEFQVVTLWGWLLVYYAHTHVYIIQEYLVYCLRLGLAVFRMRFQLRLRTSLNPLPRCLRIVFVLLFPRWTCNYLPFRQHYMGGWDRIFTFGEMIKILFYQQVDFFVSSHLCSLKQYQIFLYEALWSSV